GSTMLKRYSHFGAEDKKRIARKLAGVETEGDKQPDDTLKLRICPICATENVPTNSFCAQCGTPLNAKVACQIQELRKMVETHPMFKDFGNLDEYLDALIDQKIQNISAK
ncbi:zinc-ribbon domain-containing protein, partial [Methanocalculus sp.]|uniref:zinc-ribbon domain-containing protein n=1 Tax=Methanocalculus sp. TaxID=2004547 RepID=UPI0026160E07